MTSIQINSLKSAERNGGGKPYLARLVAGPRGTVERLFVKPTSKNGRKIFATAIQPGDVYEARRWGWDSKRGQYFGGSIWFGVQMDGSLYPLTRDEALRAVGAVAVADHSRPAAPLPVPTSASRMMPEDVWYFTGDAAQPPLEIDHAADEA